jgi:hypothetical protein
VLLRRAHGAVALVEAPGPGVVDHHVGPRHETLQHVTGVGMTKVDAHRPLPADAGADAEEHGVRAGVSMRTTSAPRSDRSTVQ